MLAIYLKTLKKYNMINNAPYNEKQILQNFRSLYLRILDDGFRSENNTIVLSGNK